MRSLNLNYFFRRNKYFFIGCLAGFILSSIFMPAFEDCNGQRSQSSSFPSQSATLDFRLAQQLQAWFTEIQQPQYEPVQVNTSLDDFAKEGESGVQNVEQTFAKDEPLVRDKKLKFYRPRFHHTELKLRNELLLGILINSEQLSSSPSNASLKQQILEYMNTTTEQLFKHHYSIRVYYFYEEKEEYSGDQFQTKMVMASAHKGTSVETVQWGGHTSKHLAILQHLIDRGTTSEYAFFFLANQLTLLSVENLLEHLNHLTTSDEVLSMMDSGEVRSMFAQDDSVLNYGLLISASLLSACQLDVPCLRKRSAAAYSSHAACHHSSSASADALSGAITVYPVLFDSQLAHMLRSAMEAERINRLKKRLTALEDQIMAENNRTLWPPGVFGYQRAHTRYEVTRWSFWNATHAFMPNDIQVIRRLNEAELDELRELRIICSPWITDGSSPSHSRSISTVYRKFDAVRGLEYLVDLSSRDDPRSTLRLQVVKPLNPLELITDVPYVTENMHLTLVLPVRGASEVPLAIRFLNHYSSVCLKKANHATTLIIVLIYTRHLHLSESIESALEYERQEFSRLKKVSLYIQSKFAEEEEDGGRSEVKMVFLDFHPPDPLSAPQEEVNAVPPLSSFPSELAYLDLIARSLTLTSTETGASPPPFLLLHCRSNMLLSTEFLNRVRLNTIAGRQVFLPIPFVEYRIRTSLSNSVFQQAIHQQSSATRTDFRRSLAELVKNGREGGGGNGEVSSSEAFDVRKENGYFDHLNHELVAFYLADYLAARKRQEQSLPMIRNHQSVVKYQHLVYNASTDLRHLFSANSIAQMRAVEPELRLQHSDIIADSCEYFESNVHSLESCRHRRAVGLGPKQKLASIVLEYLDCVSGGLCKKR